MAATDEKFMGYARDPNLFSSLHAVSDILVIGAKRAAFVLDLWAQKGHFRIVFAWPLKVQRIHFVGSRVWGDTHGEKKC